MASSLTSPTALSASSAGPETSVSDAGSRGAAVAGGISGSSTASEEKGALLTDLQYLEAAAQDFAQPFAHRLRWSHAVNSIGCLQEALAGDSHLLEADVSAGPLLGQPSGDGGSEDGDGSAGMAVDLPTQV